MNVLKAFRTFFPVPTCGILVAGVFSCLLFSTQSFWEQEDLFSVGASVFHRGHIHRLLLFPFSHQTAAQLLPNLAAMLILCSSVEKSLGTIRFLFLLFLLSSITGFFYSLLDLLSDEGVRRHVQGLMPVTLACVTTTTTHTKMSKAFLCGVSFPTMALPWILLVVFSVCIPHSALPCNVTGILVGWAHGRGWLALVDVSEAKAEAVEKLMVFRWLRSVGGAAFVPASAEKRRKTLLPQINPKPGSYPVQMYAPASSAAHANAYEGWANSIAAPLNVPAHGHSCGHSH